MRCIEIPLTETDLKDIPINSNMRCIEISPSGTYPDIDNDKQ